MKHDYAQKIDHLWVISDSKRAFFENFYFFIKQFLHPFFQNRTFCYPTTFFESPITRKRFIFEESYISYYVYRTVVYI